MDKIKTLKLYPEQIAVAISLLNAEEKKKMVKLIPDIGRYARFQALDAIRERNKNISAGKVQSDVDSAVIAIRTGND